MLIIRSEQMKIFRDKDEQEFIDTVMNDLQANYPEEIEGIQPETLRQMVQNGIIRAQQYGLTKKYSIALFIELMFLIGPNFDEYPPVSFVLRDCRLEPNARMDKLVDSITEHQWQGAIRRTDPIAWDYPLKR